MYEVDRTSYIDKEEILKKITQEQIFEHIFNELPVIGNSYISPFRQDTNPSCYFNYDRNGVLWFNDLANNEIVDGIRVAHLNCFTAIRVYYDFPNLYHTLLYIQEELINGNTTLTTESEGSTLPTNRYKTPEYYENSRSKIIVRPLDFSSRYDRYWKSYGITREQLMRDLVYPVSKIIVKKGDKTTISRLDRTIAYSFSEFEDNRKKIYFPFRKHNEVRFITNCTSNDIGNINNVNFEEDYIVISKSYKDARVLRNMGINTIWTQSEGMLPSSKKFFNVLNKFSKIIIFFDSDEAGKKASNTMKEYLTSLVFNTITQISLPDKTNNNKVKDPSDLVKAKGYEELYEFLKHTDEFKRISP